MAALLIDHGADVNAADNGDEAPLHKAVFNKCLDVAALLIDHGADVNLMDEFGGTPLHLAAFYDRLEVADLLIEHGAGVNAMDEDGCTPLHSAASRGCSQVVALLIEHGADVNLTDKDGCTPGDLAVSAGHSKVADKIRSVGDKETGAKNGGTPTGHEWRQGSQEFEIPGFFSGEERRIVERAYSGTIGEEELVDLLLAIERSSYFECYFSDGTCNMGPGGGCTYPPPKFVAKGSVLVCDYCGRSFDPHDFDEKKRNKTAVWIGESLHLRGGIQLMQLIAYRFAARGGTAYRINSVWDGIGDWHS